MTRTQRKKRNRQLSSLAGKRVRELRHQCGYTLVDLAAAVGIDYGYLARIERGEGGERTPLAIWRDLAGACGEKLNHLVREEPET